MERYGYDYNHNTTDIIAQGQELDASLMGAAKPMSSGGTVRKCPHCGATILMQANFCGDCGSKI